MTGGETLTLSVTHLGTQTQHVIPDPSAAV